jgi:hypothetical protein
MNTEPPDTSPPDSDDLEVTPREILKLSKKAANHASPESGATDDAVPADDTTEGWYEP